MCKVNLCDTAEELFVFSYRSEVFSKGQYALEFL